MNKSWSEKKRQSSKMACWLALVALVHLLLSGCGGSGSGTNTNGDPGVFFPLPDNGEIHGRFVGTATIRGEKYFGDAIVTTDGRTRVYIGGPYADDGTIQLASPEGSINFFSPARSPSGAALPGVVIGRPLLVCGDPGSPSHRWCGRGSSASISLERNEGGQTGAIHGEITGHGESWRLDLTPWSSNYRIPARLSDLAGLYTEEVAPFGGAGMVLNIDQNGHAFFQASLNYCTGNGTFAPHGDGRFNVFAVRMTISSCDFPYFQYDGEYRGLATLSPGDYWGYDTNLRIWLADPSPPWHAVTLWGRRIPGS
jgi:hypothetical protein